MPLQFKSHLGAAVPWERKKKKNPEETQLYNLPQSLISLNNSHPLSTGTGDSAGFWCSRRLSAPSLRSGELMYGVPNQRGVHAHQDTHQSRPDTAVVRVSVRSAFGGIFFFLKGLQFCISPEPDIYLIFIIISFSKRYNNKAKNLIASQSCGQ